MQRAENEPTYIPDSDPGTNGGGFSQPLEGKNRSPKWRYDTAVEKQERELFVPMLPVLKPPPESSAVGDSGATSVPPPAPMPSGKLWPWLLIGGGLVLAFVVLK